MVAMLGVRTMKLLSFGNKTLFLCNQFILFLTTNMAAMKTAYYRIALFLIRAAGLAKIKKILTLYYASVNFNSAHVPPGTAPGH